VRNRWIAPLLIVAMTLFGLAAWPSLPDQIESHWGISGEADDTMGRTLAVLLLPLITLGLWALLVFIPRLDPRRANYASFGPTYRLIINAVIASMAVIHVAIIANGLDWGVPVARVIIVAVSLELAVIGNELGRLRPNWFAGIRTPWTLSDDEVWRRTHRVGGRLFAAAGLLTAILGMFAPLVIVFIAMIGGMVGIALGLAGYSYLLWRRRQDELPTPAPGSR